VASPSVVIRAALSRLRSQFDWPLAATITVLIIMGLTNLWSATRVAPKGLYTQQLAWLAVGVIVLVAVALSDSRIFDRMAYVIYAITIVVLIAVLVGGKVVNGSRRWVGIGALGGQPSELAKVALILAFAKLFATDPTDLRLRPWRYVGIALALFVIPGLLIAKQPDLGTALILFLIAMSVVLVVPLQLHVKLVTLGVEVGLGVLIYFFKLHDYQKRRLLTFLDPSLDPSGAGWHARQAIFAVGSGRWIGKGWTHGTQNQLQFLPEHWTDFPFAVWAEEWGFLGCLLLIGCYAILVLWALNLASEARDRFAQGVCLGCAALLFWHVVFNIGMVIGVLPVVGVTLPLVSYGGSSLITVLITLGLLMNVSIRRYSY
jgi:rod shape determining protein RodA